MDTYSQALRNYHQGLEPKSYEIVRDDGYSSIVPLSDFFDDSDFSKNEQNALQSCEGRVLDIGAGVGRHSLELQRRNIEVTAVDISQAAIDIMKQRGVVKTIHSDVMKLSNPKYDTLLMLMNGIGMFGTPEHLDAFLGHTSSLLTDKGVIIFNSVDVLQTDNPIHIKYREQNIQNNKYPGQQKLQINYADVTGSWFNWLHLSFKEISLLAQKHRFKVELVNMKDNGQYVAKLLKGG